MRRRAAPPAVFSTIYQQGIIIKAPLLLYIGSWKNTRQFEIMLQKNVHFPLGWATWCTRQVIYTRLLGALMVCHCHRMVLWHAGVFHALRTQTEILYQSSTALVATVIDHIRRSTLLTLYINNAVCKAVVPVVRGSLHWLFKQFLVAYFLIFLLMLIREFVFLM